MRRLMSGAAFAGCVTVWAGSVQTLDCTDSPPVTLTPGSPGGASAVTCPRFDGSLGTLTSMTLLPNTGGYVGTGYITLQNTGTLDFNDIIFRTMFVLGPSPGQSNTISGFHPVLTNQFVLQPGTDHKYAVAIDSTYAAPLLTGLAASTSLKLFLAGPGSFTFQLALQMTAGATPYLPAYI